MNLKLNSTLILRVIFLLIGLGVLSFFVIVIPDEVDFKKLDPSDPFAPLLVLLYVSIIPFYYALFQTMKILNYIDQSKSFSDLTAKALKYIKYSSIVFSVMYIFAFPYFFYIAKQADAPGVGLIGLMFVFSSAVAGTLAAILQKIIQKGIDLKSENELTV